MFEILFQLMSLRKSDPNVLHQNQTLLIISMIATGLKLLTRLQLGLSHLGDHKFRYKFQQCVSPVCSCGQDIETTHFFIHYNNHHWARKTLFHKINQVSVTISRQNDSTITKILLFGDNKVDFELIKILLMSTIKFISLTDRFSCPLFE